ncbi:DUF2778 domain-containing protein [Methylobacterium radiodurans]|uniref:Tlde1 domain-containing protein n=1 Tax=Methylobacterium radiodurans TaxID=2202828 RepID=A0A2U8VW44_9HYPH|nr:DUF2778 domain-containing protein [Methylobacterium radiodurans]AWN37997.1 hypothetical protein DK427_21540 [Methylobacterium radiodurans]
MTVPAYPSAHRVRHPHRRPRRGLLGRFLGGFMGPAAAATMACAVLARFYLPEPQAPEARPPQVERAQAAAQTGRSPADPPRPAPARVAWMLDPTPILGTGTRSFSVATPPRAFAPSPAASAVPVAPAAAPKFAEAQARKPEPVRLAEQTVPLPMPRPAELRPEAERPRTAGRQRLAARAQRQAVVQPQADAAAERSFFDAVFGTRPAPETRPETAMAYASLERDPVAAIPRRTLVPEPTAEATAIYDITARTVTLPSGEVLEAHSGLGPAQDNPKLVHLTMRGATPPGTYLLTEREALFHGVRAIRLNPVGGSGAVHNRVGLLAHTYMLGPSGASNGCVVFRNYDRFLRAFLRGEVRRLVVVAGSRQDRLPAVAQSLFGR